MGQREHHSFKLASTFKQNHKLQRKTIAITAASIIGVALYMGMFIDAINRDSSITVNTNTGTLANPGATLAPQPLVLLDLTGNGITTTHTFTVASNWDLSWSYGCTSSQGPPRHFVILIINNSDASILTGSQPINQRDAKGSGAMHYHTGGTFYLAIDSRCSWHVTVKG